MGNLLLSQAHIKRVIRLIGISHICNIEITSQGNSGHGGAGGQFSIKKQTCIKETPEFGQHSIQSCSGASITSNYSKFSFSFYPVFQVYHFFDPA